MRVDRGQLRRRQREQAASGSRPLREAALLGDPIFQRGRRPQRIVPAAGVVVVEVSPGSPAERAGLRGGSVITHYDGKAVGSTAALTKVRNAFALVQMDVEKPRKASVRFWRQGSALEASVPHGKLGVRLRDLSPALRQRLAGGEPMDSSAQLGAVLRSGYLGRYGGLTPLPGTRREVEQIRRTLLRGRKDAPGGKAGSPTKIAVLLGEDATRGALYEAARGSRYLHLATHGLIDETDRAIYSSLALTQPQPGEVTARNFGFLTLADLLDQWWGRLGMTELVVLSACETQRGRLESGEGVFGLSWGFMFAGAPAVVASLWQVSDASTAELMSDFYARLEAARREAQSRAPGARTRSTTKLDAFLAARKALRRKHPEPFFWAPFIYIGDPG